MTNMYTRPHFPLQPSIYTDARTRHQLKPELKEYAQDAKNVALERLGQRLPEETGGIDLPIRVRRIDLPGEGPGVYVYIKTNDRTTPTMSTPFKWTAGALSGFVLPVISFMLGRDFAKCHLAEQNLYEAKQFRAHTLTRYREAHSGNEDHYQLSKIAGLKETLLTNEVEHHQRSLAAKCMIAAGVAIGTFVAFTIGTFVGFTSGVFAVGAVLAAPLFLAGSCTAWAEWGYQAGQQAFLDKRAQDLADRTDKVLRTPVEPPVCTWEAECEPVASKRAPEPTMPFEWCGTASRANEAHQDRPKRVMLYYRG